MELEKNYNPNEHEAQIYARWEASGFFNPDNLPGDGESYTIIMPPPNANAPLHLGHALFLTIEDILIRYARMQGKKTLWLPGTDHAGFETQVVFEKKLEKEGRSRFKMQREEFYKEIWDFVQQNKNISESGIKRMGSSCDWSRNIFTLDPRIVKIVYQTFKQMHEDGILYRGERISNWCVKHQTTLSDLETKYEERQDPLYYMKYGPFTLATVRPETKFGDTAVAVNPDDKRYKQYVGKEIEVEMFTPPNTAAGQAGSVKLKVIADAAVDPEFGTGVVKVTPAHDAADFEMWQRHKDEIAGPKQVIDKFGRLNELTGPYAGLKIKEAREKIVADLQEKGLLVKIDNEYKHNIQLCYKCGTVIEPLIVPQWYVSTTKSLPNKPSLRDMATKAVTDGTIKIIPDKFEKVFMNWMENLRDWPISRQIWWGIPIPVKYCTDCNEVIIDTEDKITKCSKCGSEKLEKDPDTFDTWFSSGQWPYATFMANSEKDFETYFPTSVMETGWDILFFWVARMVMLSYYRTGKEPFKTVFLHGLVRDKDRQKMSKSKGNVIDPLGVIDTYGTDALRFALIFSTAAGNDIPLAEDKIKGMKHFANKLWNISRFILMNTDNTLLPKGEPIALTESDKQIFKNLAETTKEVTENLEKLQLHEAAQSIYQFAWHTFADIYIEASKSQLQDEKQKENTQKILLYSLAQILKMLHPFMPYITEVVWGKIPKDENKLLMIEKWPTLPKVQ